MSRCSARRVLAAGLVALMSASVAAQTSKPAACPAAAKAANLNFTLKDVDGKDVTLSGYKGKVILLDFWATWCAPCKFEIPFFVELYTKYRSQGLQVIGFDVDDAVPAIKEYAKQMKMNYPILVGQNREDVIEAFGPMVGLPTTVIIDRQGRICRSHTGFTAKETFESAILALL